MRAAAASPSCSRSASVSRLSSSPSPSLLSIESAAVAHYEKS